MTGEFSIDDLEKHSGLSIRTIHYYMQKGLLPSPDKRGKYASYSQEHLDRLDLILILKDMHLPLKEIRELLDSLTPEEIQHYRDDQEDLLVKLKTAKPDPQESNTVSKTSAIDYIKGLEKAQSQFYQLREEQINSPYSMNNQSIVGKELSTGAERLSEEERWRRVSLTDGIELLIRETRDKETLYKLERLRSFAQSLFERK
jgi:DNA-binding transcriptional MerR regulator